MKNLYILTMFISLLFSSQAVLTGQIKSSPKSYSPSEGFVAHEWGTFTSLRSSDGRILSGLEKEEEALPSFTKNLCFCYKEQNEYKGYPHTRPGLLKNVTIKMETPVIYFYSPAVTEKSVSVTVKFPYGSISQWFPSRASGEDPIPSQVFYNGTPMPPIVFDFATPHNGYIKWDVVILPASQSANYSNNLEQGTTQWTAQRQTKSNLIKAKGTSQMEKFLFYRGIGNFREPIQVNFNTTGNLLIANSGADKFNYVLVYERKKDNSAVVWWSGAISSQKVKVIERKAVSSREEVLKEMEKFVLRLVSAGLYEDEARAMLKTWEKSYFEHEGLKVFWIVPGNFTEQILPLNIFPSPDIQKRVLVGRSEILTPEFENELNKIKDTATFNKLYKNDRFELAYRELLQQGIPQQWTDYNVFTEDEPEPIEEPSGLEIIPDYSSAKNAELYPNPVTGDLTVKIHDNVDEEIVLNIYNTMGELVHSINSLKKGENLVSMAQLVSGTYTVKILYADGTIISKKIVKR